MKKLLIILSIVLVPLAAQVADEREFLNNADIAKEIELKAINMTPKIAKRSTNIDPSVIINARQSIIEWKGGLKFINNYHNGNLKVKSGNIYLGKENNISGNIVIDMTTMTNLDLPESRKEYLIGHLRSEDFFHVDRFNTANLKINNSKVLEKKSDGTYEMEVFGDLTVKSVTKPISFKATVDLKSNIKKASGIMVFNRTDFNVQYRAEMHLDNAKSFWNKMNTTKGTVKDKVIKDQIEVKFEVISKSGMIEK